MKAADFVTETILKSELKELDKKSANRIKRLKNKIIGKLNIIVEDHLGLPQL